MTTTMHMTRPSRALRRPLGRPLHLVLALAPALAVACGPPSGDGELTRREGTMKYPAAPAIPGADPALRYRGEQPEDPHGGEQASILDFDTPEGWTVLSPTQHRLINLSPAGDPDAECYVALLPSDGGGIVANVNRWLDQVGLEPISEEEAADLPRRAFFGGAAVLVDCEGVYTGMGGPEREGWRLLGLILPIGGQTLFVKMTGPAELLAAEMEGFDAFCASVRPSQALLAQVPGELPEEVERTTPQPSQGLRWAPPEGWKDMGPGQFRVVAYGVGSAAQASLSLARGSRLMNYNRWQGQVGLGELTEADIDALPKIVVLGEPCPLLEVTGEYRGMSGGAAPNTTVLATMRQLDSGDALFVKLVGPAAEVAAARDAFEAFAASVREER